MNRILHTVLVFTFVACLSSAYVSMSLWASSCCGSNDGCERPSMRYGGQRYQKGIVRRVQRKGLLLLFKGV